MLPEKKEDFRKQWSLGLKVAGSILTEQYIKAVRQEQNDVLFSLFGEAGQ